MRKNLAKGEPTTRGRRFSTVLRTRFYEKLRARAIHNDRSLSREAELILENVLAKQHGGGPYSRKRWRRRATSPALVPRELERV